MEYCIERMTLWSSWPSCVMSVLLVMSVEKDVYDSVVVASAVYSCCCGAYCAASRTQFKSSALALSARRFMRSLQQSLWRFVRGVSYAY